MEAQQQQQQAYHYQYQTPNDPNSAAALSLSYDSSSQVQSYDQSTQAYYSYHHYNQPQQPHHQQPQQDYSSYYYPDYSSSYQTLNDPNSIHPPGVPIPADTQQSHLQNTQNLYYSHGVSATQPPPSQGYTLPSNITYRSEGGNHTGQSVRGGGTGRGTFGRHGRGRGGGGRGKRAPSQTPVSSSGPVAAPLGAKPPPQKAWCELCKVECNTLEILEQHRNGKKHQKNLKVHEELQNLSQPKTTQNNPQIQVSHCKNLENAPTNKPENAETKSEAPPKKEESTRKAESSSGVTQPSEKSVRKDRFIGRGGGFKRGIRGGGRGGKFMKAYDGSRRQPVFEPLKPKQLGFPVVCELCNVKCESQVVYDSHIAGKKHLANAKRVQAHNGEGGLQALCQTTAIPNLPSTSIIVPPQHHQSGPCPGPQDAQALASMMLSQQNLQDPQAAQAALTQLLSQHGIHDAQTLLVQLIPYLLTQTQFQVPVGSIAAAPLAGFGMVNSLNPQTQGMMASVPESKVEEQNVTNNNGIEGGVEEQNVTNSNGIEGGVEKNGKSGEEECLDKKPVEGLAKEEQSVVEKEKQSAES